MNSQIERRRKKSHKKISWRNLLSSRTSDDMQKMKMITNHEYEKFSGKPKLRTFNTPVWWKKKKKNNLATKVATKNPQNIGMETSPLKVTKANGLLLLLFLHELFMVRPCFRDSSNVCVDFLTKIKKKQKTGKTMNENKKLTKIYILRYSTTDRLLLYIRHSGCATQL